MSPQVLVISNPASGDRSGPAFLSAHVLPLLSAQSIPYLLQTTSAPGHAGELALDWLSSLPPDQAEGDEGATIIAGGGDGTLHEVVNCLLKSPQSRSKIPKGGVKLVILPLGTANALYYSYFPPSTSISPEVAKLLEGVLEDVKPKLLSLGQFLAATTSSEGSKRGATQPLALAETSFLSPNGNAKTPEPIISCVVTSTSLHAAILDTAESLREEYPGVERFKQAAARNIDKWYEASVRLLPVARSGKVQLYDTAKGGFVELKEGQEGSTTFDEPVAYFLSAVNVDRLEPAFRIAPLSRSHSLAPDIEKEGGSMDLLLIRPKRDPAFTKDLTGARAAFGGKVMQAMMAAYEDGKHVGLRYDVEGAVGKGGEDGEGKTVVEYFRCGGWEWEPEAGDKSARLVCADGTIVRIPEKGKAVCKIVDNNGHFSVWA